MNTEILLVDKPKGITSFDVIRRLRKKLGIRKMGHAGTLDPLATGLMIIAVGKDTKKLNEYLKLPKTYEAEILLGKRTTTGDLEGEVLEEKISEIDINKVQKVLREIKGKIKLPVPVYSAIKVKGQPLYKMARKGISVNPPIKEMEILDIKLLDNFKKAEFCILSLEIEVASGTYIRSIAEELGKRLDVPATLSNLKRTQIGKFKVKDALTIEDIPLK